MSFLGNLFGKLFGNGDDKNPLPRKGLQPATPTSIKPRRLSTPANTPTSKEDMIRVFDRYGRELFLTRQQWRDSVLLGNIKNAWNNPDELYNMIVSALQDGFRSDVIEAAEHLYQIDSNQGRAACIWGIILMEENRLTEAEKVFRDYTAKHGEEGYILTNIAKVYAKKGNNTEAERILWHALEIDPNQENGMGWYEVIHRERGGAEASLEALRRIAAIPSSWRAQLWLARAALQANQLEQAKAIYRESLSRAGSPTPADLLMQMSGDLGNCAHLPELLNLTEPHFDVNVHGIQVGNNLIKAHLDLGQIDEARRILEQLYALRRPDWKQTLSFWDTEIAKTRVSTSTEVKPEEWKVAMLTIEGPVWLKPCSPAADLFPAKAESTPLICFLGSTAEVSPASNPGQQQLSDGPGRMSRVLPLFLAEQVEFASQARVRTLVPWVMGETGAFVLGGIRWSDETASDSARQGDVKSDFVVITHLATKAEPWKADLRLVRTIDGKCIGTLEATFASTNPETAFLKLAQDLLALLVKHTEVEPHPCPPLYDLPVKGDFFYYLLRLEQLLATRCAGMETTPGGLSGERDIIDGTLQLCVACPKNITVRLLLGEILLTMKRARPEVLPEFAEKIALLQKEHPLPEPSHSVAQRLINDALAA